MNYFNTEGFTISKITLGTVALGMDYGISNQQGQPSLHIAATVLSQAIDSGINTFDTARVYGDAEELIGKCLMEDSKKEKPHIVTKFKLRPDEIADPEKAWQAALKSVQTSSKLLNTACLPMVLYHNDGIIAAEILLELLTPIFTKLKNEGLVKIAGVSVYDPAELCVFGNEQIFQAFQVPMNIFDRRLIRTGMLPELEKQHKMVFVRSVFLQGLFFMPKESLNGNLVVAAKYLDGLRSIARQENMTVAQLAFSWLRDMKGLSSLVIGAVSAGQVRENVALLNGPSISERAMNEIDLLVADLPPHIVVPGQWVYKK